jgi:predicted RND superfamily exporter protein
MILITGFFANQITNMEMFTKFLDLFPANHPYVKTHKFYAKYFGGAYQATLMLEVKNGDVFNFETLKKMQQIHMAGDCKDPRLIMDAIADGYTVGCGV